MKELNEMTPTEIKEAGYIALKKTLGITGLIRFLSQFSAGTGNYTLERNENLADYSVEDAVKEIKQHFK